MSRTSPISILSPSCQYDSKAIPVETITFAVSIDGTQSRDVTPTQTVSSTLSGDASFTWNRNHHVFPFFTPSDGEFGVLSLCCGDRAKPAFNVQGGNRNIPNAASIDCSCAGVGCPGGYPKSGTPAITLIFDIDFADQFDNTNRKYILSAIATSGDVSGCGFSDTINEDGNPMMSWDWQSDPLTLTELMGGHSIDITHTQAAFYTDRTSTTHAHITITLA